jgi:hypothetical protein
LQRRTKPEEKKKKKAAVNISSLLRRKVYTGWAPSGQWVFSYNIWPSAFHL